MPNNTNWLHPEWLPPETAPKDGSVFLANIGFPCPVVCSWNGASGKWVYADIQCGMYEGEWNDTYFENDWAYESSLIAWLPLTEMSLAETPLTNNNED